MIMDMATGNTFDEFGQFAEEVLNAGGLPHALVEQLGLQQLESTHRRHAAMPPGDPDSFLQQVYRFQE